MTSTDIALIVGCVGSVLSFFGILANMLHTTYIAARNRRWQLEDAALAKTETEAIVRHAGKNVENLVVLKATEADDARKDLAVKVAEGTANVTAAIKETNGGKTEPQKVFVANPSPIDVRETK